MRTVAGEARRALSRLRRSVEKARRELGALREALEPADEDFPADKYQECDEHLAATTHWIGEEEARLRAKTLHAAGMEPGNLERGRLERRGLRKSPEEETTEGWGP